ncbi:MAG: DegV family protein [Chloroflexi bacterium]|nr:DegV family protein [Chloroflexota bacterium]
MTVAIVTDSTSDIPRNLADALGIRVVPLNVHFGDEAFLDGETITADEFFHRLESGGVFPKTSQPSVGAFAETYRELAGSGATEIVSIHISSRVSGTYNSAIQARSEIGDRIQVHVVDTLQASMGLGLVVIEVARAVKNGINGRDAASLANELAGRARFFGLLDTLEYLHKGGRIGRAQLFLGSLLKIHPILTMQEGVAHPLERARTRSKGIARMKEITADSAPLRSLAVMHTTEPDEAARLADGIRQHAPDGRVTVTQFGPVLGTYLGPGALGISLIRDRH